MKFIVEENCFNHEAVMKWMPFLKPLLDTLLNQQKLSSLDYFVIADSTEINYRDTVLKYASLVGTEAHVTQDSHYVTVGKALNGIDQNGNLHQAIIINSSIWVRASMEYSNVQGLLKNEDNMQADAMKVMSLALLLHEIGHVVDHENQYNMFGTINTKVAYNLGSEFDEYCQNNALSLWSEYFAESFAYQIINSPDDLTAEKEDELIYCIKEYSLGADMHSILERAYRILYYFVIRIAYIHQSSNFTASFNYSKYEKTDIVSNYLPFLARTELSILNLRKLYPKWKSCNELNELAGIFADLIKLEYTRHKSSDAR